MNEPTHIDLFSGIGGFALAAQWAGFRTVAFCEIEPYCQAILEARFGAVMADATHANGEKVESKSGKVQSRRGSAWPCIYPDIRQLDGTRYRGAALLTGGFPCQPFSVAGKRRGAADDRFLWPEMLRVIDEARPAWVLGENVAGIIPMELDRCLSDLESIGYACWPLVIPAVAVDAKHRRDRVWIVGYTECAERWADTQPRGHNEQGEHSQRQEAGRSRKSSEALADSDSGNEHGRDSNVQMGWQRREGQAPLYDDSTGAKWLSEPDVGRVAHGISARVDRLKALANAIVPQVAFEILCEIRRLV